MSNEIVQVQEMDVQKIDGALAELVTRAEYDVQIATAKKYPRSVKQFMNAARELVTLTEEIADDCIYALPRDGKNIEGPSARFAEVILHAWGHSRAAARIINDDGRFVTAQGVCHDLQNNTLISYEVRRRITNNKGRRFNDDMIGVTANAACSIALRNSILKVVPKALWQPIYEEAKRVVIGNIQTLANKRAKALELMQKFGATHEMVFKRLGVAGVEDITLDHLVILRGFVNALKEGEFTVETIFNSNAQNNDKTEKLNEKYLGTPEIESQPPQSDNVPVIDIPSEEVGAAPQQEMPDMEELAEVNQAITELTNMPESTPEELKTKADTALTLIKTKVLTKLDAMHALNAAEFMQKLADNGLMMHRKKLSEA